MCTCVCVSKRECVYLRRPLCAPQTQPAEVRGPTNNQLTQERDCRRGNEKRVSTCESRGTPKGRMGDPSCCSSFTAAGTSVGTIPPPPLCWSLVQAVPYGRVCYQVSGCRLVVGAAGGGGGAAYAAVGVCLEEIRKTKNTEALDDSSYSYGGGGLPGPVFTAACIRNTIQHKLD